MWTLNYIPVYNLPAIVVKLTILLWKKGGHTLNVKQGNILFVALKS